MDDEYGTFRRYNYQKSCSAGVDKLKTAEDMVTWWEKYLKRKIRFLFIKKWTARTREDMINENFYNACINILKDSRYPKEKTPRLYHLKAKIVVQQCKWIQSFILDPHEVSLFRRKARPFSISYKWGNCGIAHDYRHYR